MGNYKMSTTINVGVFFACFFFNVSQSKVTKINMKLYESTYCGSVEKEIISTNIVCTRVPLSLLRLFYCEQIMNK